jgi:hypothetical protein
VAAFALDDTQRTDCVAHRLLPVADMSATEADVLHAAVPLTSVKDPSEKLASA